MSQMDSGRNSNDITEEVFLWLGGAFLLILVVYFFYMYPWYYSQLYLFKALNMLPSTVQKFLFFHYPRASELIPLISNDLAFYADSFKDYYRNDEQGIRKFSQINHVSFRLTFPYMAIAVLLLIFLEFKPKGTSIAKPGKKYAMTSYAKSQKEIWPYIKPIVNIMDKIVKTRNLDEGWFAASSMPISWLKDRELVVTTEMKGPRKLLMVKERKTFFLDRRKTFEALRGNLGPLWGGIDALTFERKLLFCIITSYMFGETRISRILNRKASSYYETDKDRSAKSMEASLLASIKADMDEVISKVQDYMATPYFDEYEYDSPFDPLLDYFDEESTEEEMFKRGCKYMKEILLTHAYEKTVFFAILERSWTYGVLSSAELNWVKKVDRDIHYVMNQQGRYSSFVEVCGAWSHFLSEKNYGFRTLPPQLYEGVMGLDHHLYHTHKNYMSIDNWGGSPRVEIPKSKGSVSNSKNNATSVV